MKFVVVVVVVVVVELVVDKFLSLVIIS